MQRKNFLFQKKPYLLLGVGNILCRDEGAGSWFAQTLLPLNQLSDDVEVMDIGTCGMDSTFIIEGRKKVVVVDGISRKGREGTILRLPAEAVTPFFASHMSLHEYHLLDAIHESALHGTRPEKIVFFLVRVKQIDPGIGLTSIVRDAFPSLYRRVFRELYLSQKMLRNMKIDVQ